MIHIKRLLIGIGSVGALILIVFVFLFSFPYITIGIILLIISYLVGKIITDEIYFNKNGDLL